MRNDPITITRTQLGQWASYIGGTALLIGAIGFVWQGGFSLVITATLIIGAVGLALWALFAPSEFRGFFTGRQVRYGTSAVFGTLLLIGIVALVYVVLQRSVLTLDMTEGHRFTLSDETRNVLGRISRPIRITGFYSPRALQIREVDDQFFRLYETESDGKITREYVDPDEEPAKAQQYNASYDGEVMISFLNADGSIDFSTLARLPRTDNQERDMSEAISRLLISGTVKVYFEISHGELDPLNGSQQGLSGINNGIQESGLITNSLNLFELGKANADVPADAAAIIMPRPTTDLNAAEIAVLERYLQKGGALFIMADVLFNADGFLKQDGLFNQFLWNNYGVRALDAVVVDTGHSSETALDVVSAAIFPDNEIATRLDQQNAPTLFKIARAVEVSETPPADTPNGRVIMSSSWPDSYGETNLKALGETNTYTYDEGQDIAGPLATVVWTNNRVTGAKILLVGDSDFVTNGQVLTTNGNGILFTDGLSWLTGFGEKINFAPQAYTTGLPLVFITGQNLDLIAFVTVILLPGLMLATGLIVWVRRMRA